MSAIADKLVAYRKANKITQSDLARILKTTQQSVANWEGGATPRGVFLSRIQALLNRELPECRGDLPNAVCRSAIQIAFLKKAQELVDSGKLDDSTCVELLASWRPLF